MKKLTFILIPTAVIIMYTMSFAQDDWNLPTSNYNYRPFVKDAFKQEQYDVDPEILRLLPEDVRSGIEKARKDQIPEKSDLDKEQDLTQELDADKEPTEEEAAEKELTQPEDMFVEQKEAVDYSKIEAYYRYGYASSLSKDLSQFGYDIFESATVKPSKLAVPDEEYVLGPGDKLGIRVWGSEVDAEFTGEVSRNGSINVPKIGIVQVAGVKFGAVESIIRKEAEKYIQGININVSLQELRSVEVYVVGSVNNPGLHLVPAFSTILGGLISAGGVQKSGSLRHIKLYRNGKQLRIFDLYELLLKGSRKSDVVLEDRDVLFIPRIGKNVAVAGAVTDEAIFELKNEKTVGDIIDLAGGILPQGFAGRLYLRRFDQNREFVVQDIDTQKGIVPWKQIKVNNGDLVELQFVPVDWPAVVQLEGHIWMPDVFQYRHGLKLSDILTSKDLLKPGAMMDFGHLYRFDKETSRTVVKKIPLSKVFSVEYDEDLYPHDRIVIFSREELGIVEEIAVNGAVLKPGAYPYNPKTTLEDVIALAGGKQFGANTHGIEVSRQIVRDNQVITKHIVLNLETNGDFLLQPYDYIFVPKVKDATYLKTVTISGEVKFPGEYRIKEGELVSDLIERAGGFTDLAYYYGASYTSEDASVIQKKSIDSMIRNLQIQAQRAISEQAQTAVSREEVAAASTVQTSIDNMINKLKALQEKAEGRVAIVITDLESFRGSEYDFELHDGDALHIPMRPNFVAVVGSVFSPSSYLYSPNKSYDFYLEKSGGPQKSADEDQIYILKANGEVVSIQSPDFGKIELMPGDTIVVPEDVERVPYLRLVRDVADILFKIAVTAGVVVALF